MGKKKRGKMHGTQHSPASCNKLEPCLCNEGNMQRTRGQFCTIPPSFFLSLAKSCREDANMFS